MYILLAAFFTILTLFVASDDIATKCTTCRLFVDKFFQEMEKTAKSNFGGGNTHWEEKNLKSYIYSETRLLEILEGSCESSNKECQMMIEENEEFLEDWWFGSYAKGLNVDLKHHMCIDTLKYCCPNGTYGADCRECPNGKMKVCSGHGTCDGDGTRSGKGNCSCHHGYSGDLCDGCSVSHYVDERNATYITCKPCHVSCEGGCRDNTSKTCQNCTEGWKQSEQDGCTDIDECESDPVPCGSNQYCLNNDGSYSCLGCHSACNNCTGGGPDHCVECSGKHYREDNLCKACHMSCNSSCTDDSPRSCDDCATGWRMTDEKECQDVDECDEQTSRCSGNTFCVNYPGSFSCQACHTDCDGCTGAERNECLNCRPGYSKSDNGTCIDFDECVIGTYCQQPHELCVNSVGSYRCTCTKGYIRISNKCVQRMAGKSSAARTKNEATETATDDQSNEKPEVDRTPADSQSATTSDQTEPDQNMPDNKQEL